MKNKKLFLIGFVSLVFALNGAAANIEALDLRGAANTSFRDDVGEDEKGGWTDQGGHDLRVIKPGTHTLAGVPFEILADSENENSAIVLSAKMRPYLGDTATLAIPEDKSGDTFYLLHAGGWCPDNQTIIGRLTFTYADGTTEEKRVRGGRDVMDWCANKSAPNAARVWTDYNGNMQVSLYAAKFPLTPGARLVSVEFKSEESIWMIAAASIGDGIRVEPIKPDWRVKKSYDAPTYAFDANRKFPDVAPRNIILIIGDGMGQGAYALASQFAHGAPGRLVMEQMPYAGLCLTYSLNSSVTDSAASGTAIATGWKVNNSNVGMSAKGTRLTSVAESARDLGKSVAIITADSIAGATPAAFFAHQPARGMTPEIVADAAVCDFDILIGNAATRGIFKANGTEQKNLIAEMEARGYAYAPDSATLKTLPRDAKILGLFESKEFSEPGTVRILGDLATFAIGRMDANEKGFFMMVESLYPDYGGHGNNPDLSVLGTLQADWTVKAALEYASGRDDTLVIVTADHETGSLQSLMGKREGAEPAIYYGGSNHSGALVPIYAYGPRAATFEGIVNNIEIARHIATFWGFDIAPQVDAK